MPEKKKQHYVPRFYLKNFSWGARKAINVHNIKNKLDIPGGNLKNQCYEPYFYGKNLKIENAFEKIEGITAHIISDIIKTDSAPKRFSEEHHALLTFVLMQQARTKYRAEANNELADTFAKMMLTESGKFSDEELEGVNLKLNNPTLFSVQAVAQTLPIGFDLNIKVLVNKTNIKFITSDNPVIFYNQYFERHPTDNSLGLASKGLQIFLPISPNHSLIFFDAFVYKVGESGKTFNFVINRKDVTQLNDLQWLNALENIYYDNSQVVGEIDRGITANAYRRIESKLKLTEYGPYLKVQSSIKKIGLNAKCIKQKNVITRHEIENDIKLLRDRRIVTLFELFRKFVDQGKYKETAFAQFLVEMENMRKQGL